MIIILSPSKTLGKIEVKNRPSLTKPQYLNISTSIIESLRKLSPTELRELMSISPALANLTYKRILEWHTPFTESNSHAAILSFKGDVYEGLQSNDFTYDDLTFAQNSLRILSGLYGALRPLDLMQPYRLEMGTKLVVGNYSSLYKVWEETLTAYFNALTSSDETSTLINLASNEYSKAINLKKLNAKIVTPIFKEQKGNTYTTIAIHAKRARGLMARFAIKNRIKEPDHLKAFAEEGYTFSPSLSKESDLVFIR